MRSRRNTASPPSFWLLLHGVSKKRAVCRLVALELSVSPWEGRSQEVHMHSHAGKSLGSCTCSLIGLIVQAPNEAVPVQSREDLSALFLHTPHLLNPCFSQRLILSEVRMWHLLPRSGFETSAQEMSYSLTPGKYRRVSWAAIDSLLRTLQR